MYVVRSPVGIDEALCVALCGAELAEIAFVQRGAVAPAHLATRRELGNPWDMPEAAGIVAAIAELSSDERLREIASAVRDEVSHLGANGARGEVDAWVLAFLVPILRALIRRSKEESALVARMRAGATIIYSRIGPFLSFRHEPSWGDATRTIAARHYAGVVADSDGVIELFRAEDSERVPAGFWPVGGSERKRFVTRRNMTAEQIVRAWDGSAQ